LDRFEVSGDNLPGNKFDDFNDGTIAPFWEVYEDTVVESVSSGLVTFKNPGMVTTPFQLGSLEITSEMSYIGSLDPLQMENGKGDFQGASRWTPTIPASDQFYTMGVQNDTTGEDISIGVFNFSPAAANVFGLSPGLGISFGRYGDVGSGDFEAYNVPITLSGIVDYIVLQIAFDDSEDEYTASYRLGSSGTLQGPFPTITSGTNLQELGWYLGAESWDLKVVPIPAAFWFFGSALLGLVGITRRKKAACQF